MGKQKNRCILVRLGIRGVVWNMVLSLMLLDGCPVCGCFQFFSFSNGHMLRQILEDHVPSFVLSLFEDRLKAGQWWRPVTSQNERKRTKTRLWVFPKIWENPQIIHFNRVFHYFHHPFWVFSPIFGNIHIKLCSCTRFFYGKTNKLICFQTLGHCGGFRFWKINVRNTKTCQGNIVDGRNPAPVEGGW